MMKTMWTGLFQLSSISLFMSFLFIVVCVLSCAAEIDGNPTLMQLDARPTFVQSGLNDYSE
jgi:hypothetical protein